MQRADRAIVVLLPRDVEQRHVQQRGLSKLVRGTSWSLCIGGIRYEMSLLGHGNRDDLSSKVSLCKKRAAAEQAFSSSHTTHLPTP